MNKKQYIFAGGGTGGHIYPGIAVAEQIRNLEPDAKILFACSTRQVDSHILSRSDFDYITLDAKSPSPRPDRLLSFLLSLKRCMSRTKQHLTGNTIIIATGGFVSVPVVLAARKAKIPIALINVDMVPGKANRMLARFADKIFLQFEDTTNYFKSTRAKPTTIGCPLRKGFLSPRPCIIAEELGLDKNKKTLLVTGASSGAASINKAIVGILDELTEFTDSWQIIHLTGRANLNDVRESCKDVKINYHLLDYCDRMQDLYAAADLIIGRAGAVSIAEFTAAAKPVICLPYPYHKDKHQYLNAAGLCRSGAAVIIDDIPENPQHTRKSLLNKLKSLMANPENLNKMKNAASQNTPKNAAKIIAQKLTS